MARLKRNKSSAYNTDLQYIRNYIQKMNKYGSAYMTRYMLKRLRTPLFRKLFEAYAEYYKAHTKIDAIALEYALFEEI